MNKRHRASFLAKRPPLFYLRPWGRAKWSPIARVQRGSSETARCTSTGDHLACSSDPRVRASNGHILIVRVPRAGCPSIPVGAISNLSCDRDLRYRTCVVEHSFICPFCGEEISMVLDLSVRRHTYVEDCEVCCNSLEISYTVEDDSLTQKRVAQ